MKSDGLKYIGMICFHSNQTFLDLSSSKSRPGHVDGSTYFTVGHDCAQKNHEQHLGTRSLENFEGHVVPSEYDEYDANENASQVNDDRCSFEVFGQLGQAWRVVHARVAPFSAFQAPVLSSLVQVFVVVMAQRRSCRFQLPILVQIFVAKARVVASFAVALIGVEDEAKIWNISALQIKWTK